MHAVLRADGGPEIGYGHLVRTSAVAEDLLLGGDEVTLATTTPERARAVFPPAVEVVDLPTRGDPAPFVERLDDGRHDVVFADAYPVDLDYQRAVRKQVPLAIHRDDDRVAIRADVLVNGNLYAPDLEYAFEGSDPRVCLGTDYALLRRAVGERAARDAPWRPEPERAIVTMGGSDVAGLTPTVLRAFDGHSLRVEAVVGPGFSRAQEQRVREAAAAVSADVRVVRDPDDLPERMFRADVGVSTASSTVYELLALGTPTACTAVADNQERLAAALRERDVAAVVDADAGVKGFSRAIENYSTDEALRRRRREEGRELVDGRGVERTVDAIRTVVEP